MGQAQKYQFLFFDAGKGRVYDKQWLEQNCYGRIRAVYNSICRMNGIVMPSGADDSNIVEPVQINGKDFVSGFTDYSNSDQLSLENDILVHIPCGKYYVYAVPMQTLGNVV